MRYDFPGNIRELENVIERAFILCNEEEIGLHHLPPAVAQAAGRPAFQPAENGGGLADMELVSIRAALERHHGNKTRAARDLGIHRTTLDRKLKRRAAAGGV
jgi:transcriptional regulator with PAS, ATPase and Fis domain